MSVTQADLLVVFLEKTNLSLIKELFEVVKLYPKDAILNIIDSQLTRQALLKLFRLFVPVDLPITSFSGSIGVSNLD